MHFDLLQRHYVENSKIPAHRHREQDLFQMLGCWCGSEARLKTATMESHSSFWASQHLWALQLWHLGAKWSGTKNGGWVASTRSFRPSRCIHCTLLTFSLGSTWILAGTVLLLKEACSRWRVSRSFQEKHSKSLPLHDLHRILVQEQLLSVPKRNMTWTTIAANKHPTEWEPHEIQIPSVFSWDMLIYPGARPPRKNYGTKNLLRFASILAARVVKNSWIQETAAATTVLEWVWTMAIGAFYISSDYHAVASSKQNQAAARFIVGRTYKGSAIPKKVWKLKCWQPSTFKGSQGLVLSVLAPQLAF